MQKSDMGSRAKTQNRIMTPLSVPRLLTRLRFLCLVALLADLDLPELVAAAMALNCHVPTATLVFRSRHPRRPVLRIREFGLVGFQDRLAVELHRNPVPANSTSIVFHP
jgi:hypothetical protein